MLKLYVQSIRGLREFLTTSESGPDCSIFRANVTVAEYNWLQSLLRLLIRTNREHAKTDQGEKQMGYGV